MAEQGQAVGGVGRQGQTGAAQRRRAVADVAAQHVRRGETDQAQALPLQRRAARPDDQDRGEPVVDRAGLALGNRFAASGLAQQPVGVRDRQPQRAATTARSGQRTPSARSAASVRSRTVLGRRREQSCTRMRFASTMARSKRPSRCAVERVEQLQRELEVAHLVGRLGRARRTARSRARGRAPSPRRGTARARSRGSELAVAAAPAASARLPARWLIATPSQRSASESRSSAWLR